MTYWHHLETETSTGLDTNIFILVKLPLVILDVIVTSSLVVSLASLMKFVVDPQRMNHLNDPSNVIRPTFVFAQPLLYTNIISTYFCTVE